MTARHQFDRIEDDPPRRYDGIVGLTGREPVGAQLAIGLKLPSGAIKPNSNDQFYVKLPDPDRPGIAGVRALHPLFPVYNEAPKVRRQVIIGNLVHSAKSKAWTDELKAQTLKGDQWPSHPLRQPACVGDGEWATRYHGTKADGSDDFRKMVCPDKLCEFRQGDAPSCRAWGRLYFRPNWEATGFPGLPPLLMRWETKSVHNVDAWKGFWNYIDEQARAWGLAEYSIYGIPFIMTLARKTNPEKRSNYPVVSVAVAGDLLASFHAQQRLIAAAADGQRALPEPIGADDPEENTDEVLAQSWADLSPGIPGETAAPSVVVLGGDAAASAEPPEADDAGDERRSDAELRPLVAAMKNGSLQSDDVAAEAVRRWGQIPRYLTLEQLAELVAWVEAGGADPPAAAETEGRLF